MFLHKCIGIIKLWKLQEILKMYISTFVLGFINII